MTPQSRSIRRAKIVATIGPACESENQLAELMRAGLDVARVNMSHGERAHHGEVISRIRRVADSFNRPVAVMLDLSGPKIRTGMLRGGRAELKEGKEARITSEQIEGDADRFSSNYPLLAQEVTPGGRILLSDGEIELQVVGTNGSDVIVRVIHGGVLGNHKGVNLPGARISIPAVTDKDVADLKFGIENGVDVIALSFVRSAADCVRARDLIKQFGGNQRLIAKIEKQEGVDDLSNILDVSDGVMVARGDLAVETSTELVPVTQKRIISRALIAQKTTITATQMLQSMIESPRPTRAEASDVSNAILDGSDAVMLSGETAIGRYPVEAVATMDRIVQTTESMSAPISESMMRSLLGQISGSYGLAVAEASLFAAREIDCQLIVVITQSGHMGRRIAGLRPKQRIIALTTSETTRRQLALLWGIEPHLLATPNAPDHSTTDRGAAESPSQHGDLLVAADRTLIECGVAKRGESIVVMAGRLSDMSISLSMKIHRVGDLTSGVE
jgi:pyruvate kinase